MTNMCGRYYLTPGRECYSYEEKSWANIHTSNNVRMLFLLYGQYALVIWAYIYV